MKTIRLGKRRPAMDNNEEFTIMWRVWTYPVFCAYVLREYKFEVIEIEHKLYFRCTDDELLSAFILNYGDCIEYTIEDE